MRAVLIAMVVAVPVHAQFATFWSAEENQLDIPEGGRVNTIAVSPFDSNEMFVTSESGGVFKTIDRGVHWQHVDKLRTLFAQSVAYFPSIRGVVFVTAKADFGFDAGGVWRTADGGDNWVHVLKTTPGDTNRLSAYEISISKDLVHVASSRGLYTGWNDGFVWGLLPVFDSGDPTILSVLVQGSRIYVGGPQGVRFMNVNDPFWQRPIGGPAAVTDMHAFGGSPDQVHAYVVDQYKELWVTQDFGPHWTNMPTTKGTDGCSGAAFIKVVEFTAENPIPPASGRYRRLYYSNRCDFYAATAQIDTDGTVHYPRFVSDWRQESVDHNGPRHLGVIRDTAVLLGTSGGLHRAIAPDTWQFIGGGKTGGYNALQINEVKGQRVGDRRTDLYIGTQDNNLWAWSLGDNSLTALPSEAHYLEMPRTVDSSSDCKMTFALNGDRFKSGRWFANLASWADAPSSRKQAPALIRESNYVQNVMRTHTSPNAGLAATDQCGKDWSTFAVFSEEPRDLPRLGSAGDLVDPLSLVVMYQPYRRNNGGEASRLMRIWKPISSNAPATVAYAAMNGFGGLGINLTHFGGYRVYGVDSRDPLHLIAPDVVNAQLMQSADGGENWSAMPAQLTDLATEHGHYLFRTDLLGSHPGPGNVFPEVTAISFSPQDPRLVLIGTSQTGIFASMDRGDHWWKVPNSEKVTYVTSFFWDNANTVYVSTYGRGLWKLRNRRVAASFDDNCSGCDVVSNAGSGRPPFDGSVLAFDGQVLGVRTEKGQLREVFVTPGTSVLLTGDVSNAHDEIAITESEGRDAYEPLPQPKSGIVAGVVFTKDDQLTGTVFAASTMSLVPPASTKEVKGSTDSPTKGQPYIALATSTFDGTSSAAPRETFELSASNFAAGARYEVLVDDALLKGTFTVDASGSFTAKLTAPPEPGYHSVAVRLAVDATVIDSTTFVVKYRN
ncbi:MAG: hypothetical protein JO197_21505 [Acidobacteria bacterium]|nr:hypothetical protein [Acidobacteriota bacterium]